VKHEEKALISVIGEIKKTIDVIMEELFHEDETRRKFAEERFKSELNRCQIYLSLIRRDMATDNELWHEACEELRVLGYDNG